MEVWSPPVRAVPQLEEEKRRLDVHSGVVDAVADSRWRQMLMLEWEKSAFILSFF